MVVAATDNITEFFFFYCVASPLGSFPMGNYGRFPTWKASCGRVSLPNLNLLAMQLIVAFCNRHTTAAAACALIYRWPTGPEFNVRTNVGVCQYTRRGSGTNKSAQ